jgi:C1A family cysteine protease
MRSHRSQRARALLLVAALALVFVVLVPGSASAGVDRELSPEEQAFIDEVRAEIERNGYHWTAGPTSVTALSKEERARLRGFVMTPELEAIYEALEPDPEIERMTFRDRFDWRDYDGVTPAKNQLDCGSCWAFAAAGAVEAGIKINNGVELDISEQQAIDCNDVGSDCDGGQCSVGYSVYKDPGAVSEADYPYTATDTGNCRQGAYGKVGYVDGYAFVSNTVASIKYAVETYGPINSSMHAYDDFDSYTGGCYEHGGTDPTNHAVLILGWDDSMCGGQGAWICKNSWGQNWGENGFFYIKYGSCRIGSAAQRPLNAHAPVDRLVPDQYATIQAAIDDANRGDIIRVAGGTYTESVSVGEFMSLYGGYDPTFTVRDPDLYPVIIDANGAGHGISVAEKDNIIVDGFEVTGATGLQNYGIYLKNSEATVRNCDVHDCWRGIGVVIGVGTPTEGTALIEFSSVHDNENEGIYVDEADNPVVEIRYTAIYGNGAEGIYSNQSPTGMNNNTIAYNGLDGGIDLRNSTDNVIVNNIIASNTGYGITCTSATALNSYNDVWGNTSGGYSGCSAGTGSIALDPVFCDGPGGDVSVHATSPTLGAGQYGYDMGALGIGCPIGPQNLQITQVGASLELEWNQPPPRVDVDHYVVYRDTTQIPLTPIATVDAPDTTYTDTTIPPCETYNFWVSAVYTDALEGAPSNKVTGDICYDGPSGVQVDYGHGLNEVSWSHAEGVIDYYVIMRGTLTEPPDSIGQVAGTDTFYVDDTSGGCPRDSYGYEIQPVYDTGWRGVVSENVSVDPPPAPPEGLTAEWSTDDVVLTWNSNCESDFRRYWVYRDTIPISPPINSGLLIAFLPDTTYTDENLNTDWTYFYRVAASDAASQKSDYSNMAWLGSGQVLTVPSPYGTIQEAINAASALDTVLVAPGTYTENITLKDGVFVVSSDGRPTTTIQSVTGTIVTANTLSDLALLQGFTVDGLGGAQYGLDAWGSYLRVEDCAFQNCNTGARAQFGGGPSLFGNLFTLNQNGFASADTSAPSLSGNTFDGNALGGLYVSGDALVVVGQSLASANDFVNRGAYHVFNLSANAVGAEYNWWDDVCPDVAWFYGPIDYTPWTDESHTGVYYDCTDVAGEIGGKAYASENFPNPFNPLTSIRYTVPSPGGEVRLTVYDLRGRRVRTLVDEWKGGGDYLAIWRGLDDAGREQSSGVYFYRMEIGDYQVERKMVLLK